MFQGFAMDILGAVSFDSASSELLNCFAALFWSIRSGALELQRSFATARLGKRSWSYARWVKDWWSSGLQKMQLQNWEAWIIFTSNHPVVHKPDWTYLISATWHCLDHLGSRRHNCNILQRILSTPCRFAHTAGFSKSTASRFTVQITVSKGKGNKTGNQPDLRSGHGPTTQHKKRQPPRAKPMQGDGLPSLNATKLTASARHFVDRQIDKTCNIQSQGHMGLCSSTPLSSCSRLHTSTLEMQAISRALSRLPVDFPAPLVVMGFFGLEKSQAPHPTCPTWNNRILKDAVARKSSGWHFCSQTNMLQHVTTIGTRSHFSVAGIFFTPQEPPLKGTPFRCFPAWSPGFGWTCKWLEKSLRSIIGSSNFQRVP